MIETTAAKPEKPSRKAQAEAVAWLARLQASRHDQAMKSGLRRWLDASPEHAAAFERATDLWDDLGGVPTAVLLRSDLTPSRKQRERFTWQWVTAGATACAALFLAIGSLTIWNHDPDFSTRVGEQRTITLADGSHVSLNTDSSIVLGSWKDTREVRLERGEAYFEVAKNSDKPFVVIAGDRKVIAIGTAFDVRLQPNAGGGKVSVTLVEGKVAVTNLDAAPQSVFRPAAQVPVLTQGQRLVFAKADTASEKVDLPRLDTVTSWRRGEVVLDNTRLGDAIGELNRYNATALVIDDPSTANLPISGIFRTGDSNAFADAVATLYGLTILKEPQKLVLSGRPVPH